MNISEVLRKRGTSVVTVVSSASVGDLLNLLIDRNIGCAVVSDAPGRIDGIVSERDIVHHLASDPALLNRSVATIMVTDVTTCLPGADLEQVARVMTEKRIRHIPVIEDGRLVNIVSIGDVVKNRLDQLQDERDQLMSYVSTAEALTPPR